MTKKIRVKAKAVPESHEWGYANTGTEQVGMRVVILEGELKDQSVSWYGYFTESTEQRTLEQLKVAGWDGSDLINLPGLGSTEFELQLEEETDQDGGTFLRPTFINRIGVAMRTKMDDSQKAQFAARMRALTGSAPKTGARAPATRPATATRPNGGQRQPALPHDEAPPYTDDDVTF